MGITPGFRWERPASVNKLVIYKCPGPNMGKVVMKQLPGKLQNLNDKIGRASCRERVSSPV